MSGLLLPWYGQWPQKYKYTVGGGGGESFDITQVIPMFVKLQVSRKPKSLQVIMVDSSCLRRRIESDCLDGEKKDGVVVVKEKAKAGNEY